MPDGLYGWSETRTFNLNFTQAWFQTPSISTCTHRDTCEQNLNYICVCVCVNRTYTIYVCVFTAEVECRRLRQVKTTSRPMKRHGNVILQDLASLD